MESVKVFISNFGNIKTKTVDISLGCGAILVRGANGSGKTTILESIAWVLYGGRGHPKAHGCLTFPYTLNGQEAIFIIDRMAGKGKLRVEHRGKVWEGDSAEALIISEFGDLPMFRACNYVAQKEHNSVIQDAKSEDTLVKLACGTDPEKYITKLLNLVEKYKTNVKSVQKAYDILQAEMRGRYDNLTQQEIEQYNPADTQILKLKLDSEKSRYEEMEEYCTEYTERVEYKDYILHNLDIVRTSFTAKYREGAPVPALDYETKFEGMKVARNVVHEQYCLGLEARRTLEYIQQRIAKLDVDITRYEELCIPKLTKPDPTEYKKNVRLYDQLEQRRQALTCPECGAACKYDEDDGLIKAEDAPDIDPVAEKALKKAIKKYESEDRDYRKYLQWRHELDFYLQDKTKLQEDTTKINTQAIFEIDENKRAYDKLEVDIKDTYDLMTKRSSYRLAKQELDETEDSYRKLMDKFDQMSIESKVDMPMLGTQKKLVEDLERSISTRTKLDTHMSKYKTDKKKSDDMKAELDENTSIYEKLRTWEHSARQIEQELLDGFSSQVNERLRVLSERMYNSNIRLELVMKTIRKEKQKSKLSCSIVAYTDSGVRDIGTLSGGERDIASIALTIALSTYSKFPLIILDESFESLDDTHTDTALRTLKYELGDDKTMIAVQHSAIDGEYSGFIDV